LHGTYPFVDHSYKVVLYIRGEEAHESTARASDISFFF
jgi:hypothetical protein